MDGFGLNWVEGMGSGTGPRQPVPEPDVIVHNEEAEPAAWDVVLDAFRAAGKIPRMLLLREETGLSRVRVLLDTAPRVVRKRLARAEAESLRAQLEAAGARVALRPAAAPRRNS
jgi:ribosomal protein L7/L12